MRTATASGRVLVSAEVVDAAARRRRTQGRRPRRRPHRRDPGRQAHPRPRPAVPPHRDPRRRRRISSSTTTRSAITATVRTADRTGVEMEALTCVAVAALALIDMVKAVDPAAVITDVRVEEKTGGYSGRLGAGSREPGARRHRLDPRGHRRLRGRAAARCSSTGCARSASTSTARGRGRRRPGRAGAARRGLGGVRPGAHDRRHRPDARPTTPRR